jgi:carbon monoxide dehydrogenase subunit G
MKLEGSYTFEAPRDLVWDALQDPVLLAAIMPGCEGLEPLGDDKYKTTLKIQVGPVQGVFEGDIALHDINKPDSYKMDVNGKGVPGFIKAVGSVRLEPQGETTIMHYEGEAHVGGKIASVGQRLLESSAKALTKQSLDGIAEQIKARMEAQKGQVAAQASAGLAPVPASKQTTQTQFVLGVTRHFLADAIPPERRPLAVGGGVAILALIVYVIVRLLAH